MKGELVKQVAFGLYAGFVVFTAVRALSPSVINLKVYLYVYDVMSSIIFQTLAYQDRALRKQRAYLHKLPPL
jgi:hypothetical protein